MNKKPTIIKHELPMSANVGSLNQWLRNANNEDADAIVAFARLHPDSMVAYVGYDTESRIHKYVIGCDEVMVDAYYALKLDVVLGHDLTIQAFSNGFDTFDSFENLVSHMRSVKAGE